MQRAMPLVLAGSTAALLFALLLIPAPPAYGIIVASPPPFTERIAEANFIVLGKIAFFEREEQLVVPSPQASKKVPFRVAIIEVSALIKGPASQKRIRLGFAAPGARRPGRGIVAGGGGPRFGASFKLGQEGMFFLMKHHVEDFYIAPRYFDFTSGESPNFKQDLALTRYAVKAGPRIAAGLASKDAQERFLAAALLLNEYRAPQRSPSATIEPLDAAQSKRILSVLAEGDWEMDGPITPWTLFNQLGLSSKDGWSQPPPRALLAERHRAARTWLRDHAETYRLLRIVEPPRGKISSSTDNK